MSADDELGAPAELRGPWQDHAACLGYDAATFFPDVGVRATIGVNAKATIRAAKEICATCPVREQCAGAGEHEDYGIWGGLTPDERRARRRGSAERPIEHGTIAGATQHRRVAAALIWLDRTAP